jgi:hypothetical protein
LNLDEIWNKGCWLHLATNQIHGHKFEVHTRNLLVWI